MGARIRALDWAATPLGPPETWPQSLKVSVGIMLSSRQPFWIGWGPELIYFYNDPYKSVIGGKHPWALGRPTREVWGEIWTEIGPMLDTAMAGAEGTFVEKQRLIMERNGFPEETYYTFSYSPIPNGDGTVGGIICANSDDTERVIGERQLGLLRELAARTAAARNWQEACALSAQALGTDSYDLPFAMLYLAEGEPSEAKLCMHQGVPDGDALLAGRSAWPVDEVLRSQEIMVVEAGDAALPTGAWAVPPRKVALVPIPARGDVGRPGVLVAGLNPFRLADAGYREFLGLVAGQIAAAIANAQAYEDERRRAESLAELDRAKTAFFSNVSHEFRTPLTLMLGPLEESLHVPDVPGAVREQLVVAHRNGLRLLRLVNSLLDFSRVEAGRAQASFQPLDLAGLTIDLASSFRSAFDRAGIRLTVECPPLPAPVHVDRDMWEKIVLNLLSNAFKFTLEGEVVLSLAAEQGMVVLTVRDTGTGIPSDALPQIFERFHRVENAAGRTHEGTGIGLALVQELVKLHGGSIGVESVLGEGSAFIVRIPFGTAHVPAGQVPAAPGSTVTGSRVEAYVGEAMRWLPDDQAARDDAAAPDDQALQTASPPPRILLADDNADMRDYITRLLQGRYRVEAVADGQAALDAARALRPDLVLSDVMMPRLDGFGLLQALRGDPDLAEIPIVLLSARAGEEAQIAGLGSGADDYLVKPFSAAELLARIRKNLSLAQMRRQAAEILRASEERFREMADHAPVMVWVTDIDGRCTFLSRSWYAFTGQAVGGRAPAGWLGALHPEDRSALLAAFEAASARREPFRSEYRLRNADGEYRWMMSVATPHFRGDGTFMGYIGSSIDISDRKRNELHLKLLVDELNHRVKNTLATVQSIATLGLRNAHSTEEARDAIEARLIALSRSHDLLTRTHWEGADLGDVARQALEPFGSSAAAERLSVAGGRIHLAPRQALALGMAFHELATNAVKYGALSNGQGSVCIAWQAEKDDLRIRWEEKGGPPVMPPRRRGFGARLIERGLAGELGGEVRLDFAPSGVVCEIAVPAGTLT